MTSKNINEKNRYNKITQSSPSRSGRNGENDKIFYWVQKKGNKYYINIVIILAR